MRKTYITPELIIVQVEATIIIASSNLSKDGKKLYIKEFEDGYASDAASRKMDDSDWE